MTTIEAARATHAPDVRRADRLAARVDTVLDAVADPRGLALPAATLKRDFTTQTLVDCATHVPSGLAQAAPLASTARAAAKPLPAVSVRFARDSKQTTTSPEVGGMQTAAGKQNAPIVAKVDTSQDATRGTPDLPPAVPVWTARRVLPTASPLR